MTAIINNYNKQRWFIIMRTTIKNYEMTIDVMLNQNFAGLVGRFHSNQFGNILTKKLTKKGIPEPIPIPILRKHCYNAGRTPDGYSGCILLFKTTRECNECFKNYKINNKIKEYKNIQYDFLEILRRDDGDYAGNLKFDKILELNPDAINGISLYDE